MSVNRKKSGLIIRWQKSLSILAPWRKGKEARDSVLDSAVVLTKIKRFGNFNDRLAKVDNFPSTHSDEKISHHSKDSLVDFPADEKSGQCQTYTNADDLSGIFSGSQLTRLYKFESEDSGVELSSGNAPSSPRGSDQNFAVHSRESSCDSSNLKSYPSTHSDEQTKHQQNSDISQPQADISSLPSRTEVQTCEDLETDLYSSLPVNPEGEEEMIEKLQKTKNSKARNPSLSETYNNKADSDLASLKGSGTRDNFVKHVDKCCIQSETQESRSNPLGSGLGYLEHICQLIEKIGQLQENNLRLQKQIYRLQKDDNMAKTKEDFFQHHCSCGAATLAFEDVGEVLSLSGTLSDLSTIPEISRHPLISSQINLTCDNLTPFPLWKRSLNRMSYNEGDCESTEGLSIPHRPQLGDYDTWDRVKDLVKKTNVRNRNKLGLTSTSLKMSCPQLYKPDVGQREPDTRNRNSMIVLGHLNKMHIPWLQ
ncbi:uncharacterized protein si:ch211-250c4.3 isoform X2 [Hippocampus zosterae]|uniref:uncharacterized protein si:ch211-250c4.3 isoform X2 n=1 Tax=Hippocampus zosterae TaxID=109293 RepID=UPI00223C9E4C|nr:uncharacterized protein si:ch211-250c4.3 isoform X2 [Hippocampus zosterae]